MILSIYGPTLGQIFQEDHGTAEYLGGQRYKVSFHSFRPAVWAGTEGACIKVFGCGYKILHVDMEPKIITIERID